MLREENELLTQVGPGTPGGEMLRRYWQPAALADELPAGGAPLPVRLRSATAFAFGACTGVAIVVIPIRAARCKKSVP
jgi:phthalate 4,5-dioxygenase